MPLWGYTANSQPKWLTAEQKSRTILDSRGWVLVTGTQEEVLVAFNNPNNNIAPPEGFSLLLSGDGSYVTDSNGSYLVVAQ